MRWLFIKDLQILRRSPLVTALLVVYPVVIAVLIGFALSRGPETPRVAFLNQVPEDQQLVLAGTEFDIAGARSELCSRIECIPVSSEDEAREMVRSGDALAALILPEDLIQKLQSLGSLAPSQPTVRVLVNEEDPVKARLVDDRISSLVTEANLRISEQVTRDLRQLPRASCSGAASSRCWARPSTCSASRTPSASSRRCARSCPRGARSLSRSTG